jgi:hypothetical protein
MQETTALVELITRLGVALGLALAVWRLVLTPRTKPDGTQKSAMLVPGWIHDEARAEAERVRVFYERALHDEQAAHDVRIQEWRGFRDEERARRKDAENQREQLLAAVSALSTDVQVLLAVAGVAEGDSPKPTSRSRKASE